MKEGSRGCAAVDDRGTRARDASYRDLVFVLAVSGPLVMGVVIAAAVLLLVILLRDEAAMPEDEEAEKR